MELDVAACADLVLGSAAAFAGWYELSPVIGAGQSAVAGSPSEAGPLTSIDPSSRQ